MAYFGIPASLESAVLKTYNLGVFYGFINNVPNGYEWTNIFNTKQR